MRRLARLLTHSRIQHGAAAMAAAVLLGVLAGHVFKSNQRRPVPPPLESVAASHNLEVTKFANSTYLHPRGWDRGRLNLLRQHPDHLNDWCGVVRVQEYVPASALHLSTPELRRDYPNGHWCPLDESHDAFGDPKLVRAVCGR